MKNGKKAKMLRSIMLFVIICIIILIGYLIAIHNFPAFIIYSDENTDTNNGMVTAVFLESEYTGYKSRKRAMMYIVLDNSNAFYISNQTLRANDLEYESFKTTLLNNTVEINSAKAQEGKIVSIKCGEHELLTIDDFNRISQRSTRFGLGLVCIIIIALIGLYMFLSVYLY